VREGRVGIREGSGWEGTEWDEEREGLRGEGKVKEGWEGKKERGREREGKGRGSGWALPLFYPSLRL
jgi:hypothetical protein